VTIPTTPSPHTHFLDGGPFAVCGCNFKEHVDLIGALCIRCGQRFDGPFIVRDDEQIRYTQEAQP